MQFISSVVLSALLICGIRSETEPLLGSSFLKDGHHEFLQPFHHGQHHSIGSSDGSSGGSVGVGHLVPNSQIQDQGVVGQDQVGHSSVGQVGPVGHVGHVGPLGAPVGGQLIPTPYIGQKEIQQHLPGARAIGSSVPYYPYVGKTFGSPYYSQFQSAVPYPGVYQQVYPYSVTGSPYSVSSYSTSPYAAPAVAPVYPGYNYPFVHQYYPGYPSYYHSSNEVQNANKQ